MSGDRPAIGLVVAGIAGVLISAYLTVTHYAGGTLACVSAAFVDCDAVTSSSYSLVPYTEIPVALAGLVWSAASAAGAARSRCAPTRHGCGRRTSRGPLRASSSRSTSSTRRSR